MNRRDIIVIGASAGGVSALKAVFRTLPQNLPAAVFVVLHTLPRGDSVLPQVLRMNGNLPADHAKDGEEIALGKAYLAPPDRHLLIAEGHVHLSRGPKENRTRPAINPLFRSAALTYGPRVIGVILSGTLDDGTLGLWEIKRRGGIAVVQEPDEAEYGEMAKNALRNVEVDHRAPVGEIGALLTELTKEPAGPVYAEAGAMSKPENTNLTCPECHGPLQQVTHGGIVELKCRVGHRYSPESAVTAHDESEERILWSAAESLEEGADLLERLSEFLPVSNGDSRGKAQKRRELANEIRKVLAKR